MENTTTPAVTPQLTKVLGGAAYLVSVSGFSIGFVFKGHREWTNSDGTSHKTRGAAAAHLVDQAKSPNLQAVGQAIDSYNESINENEHWGTDEDALPVNLCGLAFSTRSKWLHKPVVEMQA